MKKKILCVFFVLMLAVFPAIGQETTWINHFDYDNDLIPASMLAYVSNGIFYDEIDILVRSPTELSNYEGYTVYTAYGNYFYPQLLGTMVNPFSTTAPSQASDIGPILLGYIMPLLDFRFGFGVGFTLDTANNLVGGDKYWTQTTNQTTDADADGVADATVSNIQSYTDHTVSNSYILESGIDLGFMGFSIYGNMDCNTRLLGGSYAYTWTDQADPDSPALVNDKVTGKTVYYGIGELGKAKTYPSEATDWDLGLKGELPLNLSGLSMPLTAGLNMGSSPTIAAGYNPPKTVSISSTNLTGASDATHNSTITYTVGQAMPTGWNPITASGVLGAGATFTQAQFRALINTAIGAGPANDVTRTKDTNFFTKVSVNIDPVIKINNLLRARTRANLSYKIDMDNNTQAAKSSITYSEATDSGTNSDYSYTANVLEPSKTTVNTIDCEVGGILEFSGTREIITLGTGLFYHPTIALSTTTKGLDVETYTYSWVDNSTAAPDPDAVGLTAIGPGVAQGSRTDTTTTTYSGEDKTSIFRHNFYLPVSAKLNLVKDKLFLIGGYILNHELSTTYTQNGTGVSNSITATTVNDSAGTAVYSSIASAASTTTVTEDKTVTIAPGIWSGDMSFMLRWIPIEGMTFDFYGHMLMDALDFDIFGAGAGFNPHDFIGSVGISITWNIK